MMRMERRPARASGLIRTTALAAAWIIGAAACGTTVSSDGFASGNAALDASGISTGMRTTAEGQSPSPSGTFEDVSGTGSDGGPVAGTGGQSSEIGTSSGSSSGGSATGSQASAMTGGTTDGGTSGEPSTSGWIPAGEGTHGITDTTIQLGIQTGDATRTAATAGAISGQPTGDSGVNAEKRITAVIDYINATGGIAGRQIDPVFVNMDAASATTNESWDRAVQQACTAYTEDNRVFAMLLQANARGEGWLDCALRTRTPMVSILKSYPSQQQYDAMRKYWYAPVHFIAERRESAAVHFLSSQGFFSADAKVAVLIEDVPGIREGVKNGMLPALASIGIEPAVQIVYPDPIDSPWSTYILQMQRENVTHVIFSATTSSAWPLIFMSRAAEDQQFRPNWGVGSEHLPSSAANFSPARQMENVTVMGWIPSSDIFDDSDQSTPGTTCREIMEEAGQTGGAPVCEVFFFLRAALEHATVLSPEGLEQAVGSLGDGYKSVMTLGGATSFGPGVHGGAAYARPATWDGACSCFKYSGPTVPFVR